MACPCSSPKVQTMRSPKPQAAACAWPAGGRFKQQSARSPTRHETQPKAISRLRLRLSSARLSSTAPAGRGVASNTDLEWVTEVQSVSVAATPLRTPCCPVRGAERMDLTESG
eukprot:TRINITY_DN13796_c0_g1_i3.p4 TRINITY_DN13796_c0_g1~~TRINITY_DN13796_c0_g1_i3.p4  ORF type:complete len:113 (+),score=4.59 TRINITY_DN13796_c0_g1_i3:96-434(+)